MKRLCTATAILLFAATMVCVAADLTFHPTLPSFAEQHATRDPAWASEAWTGDDRPYAQLREKIDQQMSRGSSADSLRKRYGLLAQQRPDDQLAQFAWAYAAVKTITPETPFRDRYTDLLGVPEALNHVPFPRTYNFARVRFLAQSGQINLRALGERLLEHDLNDEDVKGALVDIYEGMLIGRGISKPDLIRIRARAISYSEELSRAHPGEARLVSRIGMVYYYSWITSRDKTDGSNAIAAFNKYLALAPKGDEFRPFAQRFITMIDTGGR